jgi:hypothetical protein
MLQPFRFQLQTLLNPVKLANSKVGFVLANQDGVLQVVGLPMTSFGEFLKVKSAANSAHLFFQILFASKTSNDLKGHLSSLQYRQILDVCENNNLDNIFSN